MAWKLSDSQALYDWLDENLTDDEAEQVVLRLADFLDDPKGDPNTLPSPIHPLAVVWSVSVAKVELVLLIVEQFRMVRFLAARRT
jgi:hypothetical protein